MGIAIRHCSPADLEQLIPLLDEEFVFGKGRTISLRQRFPTVYCDDNLCNILLFADGGSILSALAMRHFDWCAGGEIFRGAMIGAVYTHPTRRKEGLAGRLLAAAATRLRDDGVDFGVLWSGQQSFYARHGWVAADCSVLGEVESNESMTESSGDVTLLSMEENAPRLEDIRQNWLNAMTLRHPEDYRHLPLPADRVDLLWCEEQGKHAYALLGSRGNTGFLYELVGHPDNFPALWQKACHGRQRMFVNEHANSPSCRWLKDHTMMAWQDKSLTMWLPLSDRVTIPRLEEWAITYFDRI